MRVGFDVHTLHDRYQGIRTYVAHVVRELASGSDPEDHLVLFGTDRKTAASCMGGTRRWSSQRWLTTVPWLRIPFEVPVREVTADIDVFHSQYICPPLSTRPEIVTLHDILFESHPEWFSRGFVRRSKILFKLSARRAAVVVTDSEFSKEEIVATYRIPERKIEVVPLGVDHIRAGVPGGDPGSPGDLDDVVLSRLQSGFYLFVGRVDPRKNLHRLVDAHRLLWARGECLPLVLVGPADYRSVEFFEYVAPDVASGAVILLGPVEDGILDWLYGNASAVVYPTLAEGFGLPVLEAMASGAVVVTSPCPAVREFADGCVLYADPLSPAEIAAAMSQGAANGEMVVGLRRAAVQQAAKYTWRAAADRLWNIYRSI